MHHYHYDHNHNKCLLISSQDDIRRTITWTLTEELQDRQATSLLYLKNMQEWSARQTCFMC